MGESAACTDIIITCQGDMAMQANDSQMGWDLASEKVVRMLGWDFLLSECHRFKKSKISCIILTLLFLVYSVDLFYL